MEIEKSWFNFLKWLKKNNAPITAFAPKLIVKKIMAGLKISLINHVLIKWKLNSFIIVLGHCFLYYLFFRQ